ncbi:TIGR03943 family putative permease subunit [Paenibacillus sp. YN15]|uniref:TIGR03943 family putative permease subunit n=1 Tax=Paenibacillus sp. YN15 TaxID=1742774 RepID=UPI000DCC1056|nr:TIGR03943 family protein [Paenibacillus sp. YN15]RAV05423.1 TIGR03943 family protein [Paenibacillus sp. YN15]
MSTRKLGIHYFLRTGILAFFAYYILRLVKHNQLIIYIGPRMQFYVKLAAIGFYLLAVLQLLLAFRAWWGARRQDPSCECGSCSPASMSAAGHSFFYALFAVPLLLVLLLPDQALGSSLVDKKGITLTGAIAGNTAGTSGGAGAAAANKAASDAAPSASPGQTPGAGSAAAPAPAAVAAGDPLDALFPYDEYSEDLAILAKKLYKKDSISIKDKGFMETVTSIDFYMNNFVGKKVEISGFVYREEGMTEDQFVVSRFAVQCCSADAAPFGFMVEGSLGKNLKKDTWVNVSGTLGTTMYGGNEILKIDATRIQRIEAPATPYVFPDMDYFKTDP